jgi:transcriptional regulator with XRE-family HTH domain
MKEIDVFWNRVKRLLKMRNATQAQLADVCGFFLSTFQGWMYKGLYPSVLDLYSIAKALGVSMEFLLTGKDEQRKGTLKQVKTDDSLLEKAREEVQKIG